MNERIKELAVQAGNYVNETYTGPVPATFTGNPEWHKEFDKWTQFSEKFAESLIEECIQVLKDTGYPNAHGNYVGVEEIKQHFGIK